MTESQELFRVGHVIRTPGALEALCSAKVCEASLLARHRGGDFGDVSATDAERNHAAIYAGEPVISAYHIATDCTVWVITEADRTMTTLLLPSEYERRFTTAYELRFRSLFDQGRGLAFPCDPAGHVNLDSLSERARDNYLYARAMAGREYASPAVMAVSGN